jgi:hypothetical protein
MRRSPISHRSCRFHSAAVLLEQLAREVDAHLKYEDRTAYSALILGYKAPPFIGADKFEELLKELRTDWCDYLVHWTEDLVCAEWTRFGVATAKIILRLQVRARTEANLIYSLALGDGIIRLRDAD